MTLAELDRNSPMPLWAQLEAELRRRLEGGEFDERFPTDLELTESYSVSRHTVREAVRHLNSTGLLRRERGRGTVVNRTEFEQPLGNLYSLFEMVEATGVEQTSEVIALEVVTDPGPAGHLGLEPGAEMVFLARVRHAGGTPLAVDRAWLPLALAAPLLELDFTRTALYAELERVGSPVPNHGWERLTPIVPRAADRERLLMAKSDAAFFLERLGVRDGRPVEWRTTIIRGDRFRFISEWSVGNRGSFRPAPS